MGDEQGVLFTDGASRRRLRLLSLDAGLVSPGPAAENMDLYAFPGVLPRPQDGVAFSLWNNLWSVNYVFWYVFLPAPHRAMGGNPDFAYLIAAMPGASIGGNTS